MIKNYYFHLFILIFLAIIILIILTIWVSINGIYNVPFSIAITWFFAWIIVFISAILDRTQRNYEIRKNEYENTFKMIREIDEWLVYIWQFFDSFTLNLSKDMFNQNMKAYFDNLHKWNTVHSNFLYFQELHQLEIEIHNSFRKVITIVNSKDNSVISNTILNEFFIDCESKMNLLKDILRLRNEIELDRLKTDFNDNDFRNWYKSRIDNYLNEKKFTELYNSKRYSHFLKIYNNKI